MTQPPSEIQLAGIAAADAAVRRLSRPSIEMIELATLDQSTAAVEEGVMKAVALLVVLADHPDVPIDQDYWAALCGLHQSLVGVGYGDVSTRLPAARDMLRSKGEAWRAQLKGEMRVVLVQHPELLEITPPEVAADLLTVRIGAVAYLRAMWNLFWSAIRHPLSETTIDLSTGRVLYRT